MSAASPPQAPSTHTHHLSWPTDAGIEQAPTLRRALLAALDAADGPVRVDLSPVQRMDTAGIAVLVEGLRHAERHGRQLRLSGANDSVLRLLHLTRVDRLFGAGT